MNMSNIDLRLSIKSNQTARHHLMSLMVSLSIPTSAVATNALDNMDMSECLLLDSLANPVVGSENIGKIAYVWNTRTNKVYFRGVRKLVRETQEVGFGWNRRSESYDRETTDSRDPTKFYTCHVSNALGNDEFIKGARHRLALFAKQGYLYTVDQAIYHSKPSLSI